MTPKKITKKLIEDIAKAQHEAQSFYEKDAVRPTPGRPASTKEMAALRSFLRKRGLACPPSYARFLSLANGLSDFSLHLSLVNAAEVTRPPHPAIKRRYPSLGRFVIGRGNGLEFIAFDPDTTHQGEMEVVWVSDVGDEARYTDFGRLLHEYLQGLREAVTDLAARRARSRARPDRKPSTA